VCSGHAASCSNAHSRATLVQPQKVSLLTQCRRLSAACRLSTACSLLGRLRKADRQERFPFRKIFNRSLKHGESSVLTHRSML